MEFENGRETFKLGAYGTVLVVGAGFLFGALISYTVPSFARTILFDVALLSLGLVIGLGLVTKNDFASSLDTWQQYVLAFLLSYVPYLVALVGLFEMFYVQLERI